MAGQTREWWEDLATEALAHLLRTEGAITRAEAEAVLSETSWVHDHLNKVVGPTKGPQPHHITTASRRLRGDALVEETVTLQGWPVTIWIDGDALSARGRRTELQRLAAKKRRRYRKYLSWATNSQCCGSVAERRVHASIASLSGSRLWLVPSIRPGYVDRLNGRHLTVGGPLDSAGHWLNDPENPAAGVLGFAVEVKNIRSWLYPWSQETWDLLAKLGDFPDVIPVLVARRLHFTTFSMLRDIGALGHQTRQQWFADPGTAKADFDPERFRAIADEFRFHDAVVLDDPDSVDPGLVKFFTQTVYKPVGANTTVAQRAAERWSLAAPIAARYGDLRHFATGSRDHRDLWFGFCREVADMELYNGGWAPADFD